MSDSDDGSYLNHELNAKDPLVFFCEFYRLINEHDKLKFLLINNSHLSYSMSTGSRILSDIVNEILKKKHNEELVDALLTFLEPGAADDVGKQIIIALFQGDIRKAEEILLKNGGALLDVEKWSNCHLPALYSVALFYKTHKNRTEMLTLLKKYGLNTAVSSISDGTLLHVFIKRLEDVDCYAAEIVEILINSGLSINEPDTMGYPLLHWAILNNAYHLVEILIRNGANVNQKDDEDNFPLHLCISKSDQFQVTRENIIDLLISSGAKINVKHDSEGWTALHQACYKKNRSCINLLLRRGADVTVKDADGQTPFSALLYYSNESEELELCVVEFIKAFSNLMQPNNNKSNLVSPKDMQQVVGNLKTWRHFEKCLNELEQMRSKIFYDAYTFYDVLNMDVNKNVKKLSKLTKNKDFVTKFEQDLSTFPYYREDFLKIFNDALQVRQERDLVCSRLYSIFKNNLPDVVIRILADNLTSKDLPLV